jgi:hypothetical protein
VLWLTKILYLFKIKIIYNFMRLVATKIGRKKIPPPSFGAVVGSGVRDPGSEIRDG